MAALDRALAEHDRMRCPFDRGRTLLVLGSVRRRTLPPTNATEARGARGARAGDELGRISGRRPGSGELTATERRVASLAAQGLANKEIASALNMSVHTVEVHLSRTYRKRGVWSHAALAGRLAASGGRSNSWPKCGASRISSPGSRA
jgi:DNA-binding NarL/FixJ family response regulator